MPKLDPFKLVGFLGEQGKGVQELKFFLLDLQNNFNGKYYLEFTSLHNHCISFDIYCEKNFLATIKCFYEYHNYDLFFEAGNSYRRELEEKDPALLNLIESLPKIGKFDDQKPNKN